jgi:hypothetical protein
MAKKTAETVRRPPSRFRTIGVGALLGAVWGAAMWGIFTLAGQNTDGRILAYLVISTAMIGCGVAAFFGANEVRRRGERVTPRLRLTFRRR